MNKYYSYTVNLDKFIRAEENSYFGDVLVVYVSGYGFDSLSFLENVRDEFKRHSFCRNMVVISPSYNKEAIFDGLINNDGESKRVKDAINGMQKLNFYGVFVDSLGAISVTNSIDDINYEISNLCDMYKEISDQGILKVIKNRNLIMESSENYHFVKPSGKHSNKFIKVTNILENSAEISFIALNLLQFTGSNIDKIYVDTAGVFPVAYELSLMKNRFGEDVDSHSFVDTYGSYERVDDYPFRGSSDTIVLISATTSQDLKLKLQSIKTLNQSRIITLFSYGIRDGIDELVSLSNFYKKYNLEFLSGIRTYNAHDCDLCMQERSVPLSLTKSQFVFEAPSSQVYLPLVSDSDMHLKGLIKKYKDTKAFRCFHDGLSGSSDPVPDYFIDVSKLIKESQEYRDKVKSVVRRNYTIASNLIVHCNDVGAKELALSIKAQVKEMGGEVNVYSSTQLSDLMMEDKIESSDVTGVLVVAASIETGKSLLDISRLLRDFNTVPITYMVGFVKYNDEASYKKLKMDLVFCKNDYGFHTFVEIEKIILPIHEYRSTYYTKELKFWSSFSDVEIEVLDRIKYLRKVTSTEEKGACRDLFLTSPKGDSYELGKTFAFWHEDDSSKGFRDQAPVYFTISSILQKLRYEVAGRAPLRGGYIIRQLDPLLFDRFNEGIIQASVIRAAKPRELDYSASDESSKIVGSLLHRMIKNPEDKASEALPEFLLALCIGHLQIKKDHINFLGTVHLANSVESPMLKRMLIYIAEKLFGCKEEKLLQDSVPF